MNNRLEKLYHRAKNKSLLKRMKFFKGGYNAFTMLQ